MRAARPIITRLVAVAAATVATLAGVTAPAHADVVYQKRWFATAHAADGIAYGDWHACASASKSPKAASLTCGKSTGTTVSVTMSITGDAEVDHAGLSAEVGYTVARTLTTSIAYTVTVPANTSTTIYWRTTSNRTKVTEKACYVVVNTGQCSGGWIDTAYAYTHQFRAIDWKNT